MRIFSLTLPFFHPTPVLPAVSAAPAEPPANPFDDIARIPRIALQRHFSRGVDVLKKAAYPAIMTGAVGATAAGLALNIPPFATLACVSGATIMASTAVEYIIPYRRDWMPGEAEIKTDFLHNALTTGLIPEAYKSLAYGAFLYAGASLAETCGTGSFWSQWGLAEWPLAAQATLVAGIGSFGDYWKHRLLHKIPKLWPIHEIHHTSDKLTTLHAARAHALDILGTYTLFLGLGLIGMPGDALALAASFIGTQGILQHNNADFDLGKLAWIFPGPRNHRWHHSTLREESDTNFGNFLTIWDHVFGTFYLPQDRKGPEELGLKQSFIDPRKPAWQNWWGHMTRPFRKRDG